MKNMPASPSIYDICAEILSILFRNDDILFEEDYREVLPKAEQLARLLYNNKFANRLVDILNEANDECLDQEDLFEAQNTAEDLTREYADQEHRLKEFYRQFPWM